VPGFVPLVRRHANNSYYHHPELIEPIFDLFRTKPDGRYLMRDLSAKTHVPIRTFEPWRQRLRTCPSWQPSAERFAENRRGFPGEVEEMIRHFIRINFVELGRSLMRTTLQPLILTLVHDLISERILDDSFLN
jgi:hypothetical protein